MCKKPIILKIIVISAAMAFYSPLLAEVTIIDDMNDTVDDFVSMSAADFGDPLPEDGLIGNLVMADPIDACSAPLMPVSNSKDSISILMIRRSRRNENCTFDVKVYRAQEAGYAAAIVFDYYKQNNQDELVTMRTSNLMDASLITIPSVFVSYRSGVKMSVYAASVSNTSSSSTKAWLRRDSDDLIFKEIKYYLVPFVCILLVTLLFLCGLVVWRYVSRWRRERARRLPKSVLRQIPIKRFCKADNDIYDDTCAICLDDYIDGVKIRILSCGHAYHCKCIDPWLIKSRRTCPICKRRVLRSPRQSSTSSVAIVPPRRANRRQDQQNVDDQSETALLLQSDELALSIETEQLQITQDQHELAIINGTENDGGNGRGRVEGDDDIEVISILADEHQSDDDHDDDDDIVVIY